jgi:hypothetical protein
VVALEFDTDQTFPWVSAPPDSLPGPLRGATIRPLLSDAAKLAYRQLTARAARKGAIKRRDLASTLVLTGLQGEQLLEAQLFLTRTNNSARFQSAIRNR